MNDNNNNKSREYVPMRLFIYVDSSLSVYTIFDCSGKTSPHFIEIWIAPH